MIPAKLALFSLSNLIDERTSLLRDNFSLTTNNVASTLFAIIKLSVTNKTGGESIIT